MTRVPDGGGAVAESSYLRTLRGSREHEYSSWGPSVQMCETYGE